MTRHVALLRGINVGRARRLAMADLRRVMEALGWRDVATVLQSGNAVFTAEGAPGALAEQLTRALARDPGVTVPVVVLEAPVFRQAVEADPLPVDDPSRGLVAFVQDPALLTGLADLAAAAPDRLALGLSAAYVRCPEGILASPQAQALDRRLGDRVTARNRATVRRLLAILD